MPGEKRVRGVAAAAPPCIGQCAALLLLELPRILGGRRRCIQRSPVGIKCVQVEPVFAADVGWESALP